jgi:hypothetical protein
MNRSGSIGNQPADPGLVTLVDHGSPAQIALPLGGLLGQDMVGERFAPFYPAGCGPLESLGRRSISLDLGHQISSNLYYNH